jgi:ferrous iron transport protein A
MPSLDQLRPGQSGRVEGLAGDDALAQRLMEMGVLEGEEITVVSIAPLGDPFELLVRDYRLSLRRAEAARVQVVLLP